MADANEHATLYRLAINMLGQHGPVPLNEVLERIDMAAVLPSNRTGSLAEYILQAPPNDAVVVGFHRLIVRWDNSTDCGRLEHLGIVSSERRQAIYEILQAPDSLRQFWDRGLPIRRHEWPLIIAKSHEEWYETRPNTGSYYWQQYENYLLTSQRWEASSTASLEAGATTVLERLSAPYRPKAYSARGLVVGYVQSGKTSNFTALTAKAADAGYKLFIILAGTWNILRTQTQRRLDKSLIGLPDLAADDDYKLLSPEEWLDFVDHGSSDEHRNVFRWLRVTTLHADYQKLLASSIETLRPEKEDRDKPLYDVDNLLSSRANARLLVIKKNAGVLRKLIADLKKLSKLHGNLLSEIPAILIDDESDQASVDTREPTKKEIQERRAVNRSIVGLLKLLPRCQYIGYTATPYANVFIDPEDAEDLFPKDFIVSLPEPPADYLGARDFFDFETTGTPEPGSVEADRIRTISGADDQPSNLPSALAAYVLSGAIKLYREAESSGTCKYRHHTMLVHTSHRNTDQQLVEAQVLDAFDECEFRLSGGLKLLKDLYEADFRPTTDRVAPEMVVPSEFAELLPYIQTCLNRITRNSDGRLNTLVVNSDRKDNPDFESSRVWAVLVGGNKLSRGYTIEDLTISYYRRVTGQGDTLMQMGRWFGFRKGYRDLVRLYVGVDEGKKHIDLLESFRGVSHMEFQLREELKRYVEASDGGRITPLQVPPLVQAYADMAPTSTTKMYNAKIENWNFGGRYKESTTCPKASTDRYNAELCTTVVVSRSVSQVVRLGGSFEKRGKTTVAVFESYLWILPTHAGVEFIEDYRWAEGRPAAIQYQIEFLQGSEHGIERFVFLAPLAKQRTGGSSDLIGVQLPIRQRKTRGASMPFRVYSEPQHVAVARYLADFDDRTAGVRLLEPDPGTSRAKADLKTAVVLLYLVADANQGVPTVGWSIAYPPNDLGYSQIWTVRNEDLADSAVVEVEKHPGT